MATETCCVTFGRQKWRNGHTVFALRGALWCAKCWCSLPQCGLPAGSPGWPNSYSAHLEAPVVSRTPGSRMCLASRWRLLASPVGLPHIPENRGSEMKRERWELESILLVSPDFPYCTFIFPFCLPSLLTSGTSCRHGSHKSSHGCIKSNSYNKSVCVCACMCACTCVWGCFMLGNVEQLASVGKKKKKAAI